MSTLVQLTNAQCASRAGISERTWRGYVARGQAPKPSGKVSAAPWWSPGRFEAWLNAPNRTSVDWVAWVEANPDV